MTTISTQLPMGLATASSPGALSADQYALLAGATQVSYVAGNAINGLIALSVATTGYDAAVVFSRGANASKVSVGGYGDGNGAEFHIFANGYLNAGGSLVQYDTNKPTWGLIADARTSQNNFSIQVKRIGENTETLFRITHQGSIICATTVRPTNTTEGFLYIPTCEGTPTGVPTTRTGTVPLIYDVTNHRLYIYDGGWA